MHTLQCKRKKHRCCGISEVLHVTCVYTVSPKNATPYCDDYFVKSYPVFKILSLLKSILNFQRISI